MPISGENRLFTLMRCESDEVWREERRKGIGGSDVAAIMGLSSFSTPYQVYLDKAEGISDDISGKPAVVWGNILEPVVGEYYMDLHTDRHVRRVNAMARSIARPWAQASLDYEVCDPELGWGVLEIKTAGLRRADDWADGVPLYYQTQTAHYLSVTGRPFADVAVLIGGQDYREYRLMRDEEDVRTVSEAVDAFWRDHVEARVPPDVGPVDGHAVFSAHPAAGGELRVETTTPTLVNRYLLAKAELESAKAEVDRWGAKLKEYIGDDGGIECPDGRMTWRRSTTKRFDTKAFDRDNPGMRAGYMVESQRDGGLFWSPRKEN